MIDEKGKEKEERRQTGEGASASTFASPPSRSEEGRRVKQADALLRMNGLKEHTPSFIPHSSLLSITQEDSLPRFSAFQYTESWIITTEDNSESPQPWMSTCKEEKGKKVKFGRYAPGF